MSGGVPPEGRMGNDIARQFGHLPADAAVSAIAHHVHLFWIPEMRRRLVALALADPESLDPLLVAAARQLPEAEGSRTGADRAAAVSPR